MSIHREPCPQARFPMHSPMRLNFKCLLPLSHTHKALRFNCSYMAGEAQRRENRQTRYNRREGRQQLRAKCGGAVNVIIDNLPGVEFRMFSEQNCCTNRARHSGSWVGDAAEWEFTALLLAYGPSSSLACSAS